MVTKYLVADLLVKVAYNQTMDLNEALKNLKQATLRSMKTSDDLRKARENLNQAIKAKKKPTLTLVK